MNAAGLRDAIRLTYALDNQWMASYPVMPACVTLDLGDTCGEVHGRQQLSLFNVRYISGSGSKGWRASPRLSYP